MNNNEGFYIKLIEKIDETQILRNEPLANHTSFKVGGPVDFLVQPRSSEEVIYIINLCKANSMPFYIMGNGSNLLVGDKGYDGTIIKINEEFANVEIDPNPREDGSYIVKVEAGMSLPKLSKNLVDKGLSGLEFSAGIPGTVGGAMTMNAGAYDGEMKDCIVSVRALDKACNIVELTKDELDLGYRSSAIQKKGYVVLDASFALKKGNSKEILDKVTEFNKRREKKQPLDYPSAGSTFKRPVGFYAGKLIMDSGLSGYSIGGAQVSKKHCGFVINTGNATAEDIRNLIEHIKAVVYDKFQVKLEQEVKMIGNF